MSGWGDSEHKAALVEKVKEWQRMSPGHKKAWDNYCYESGHPKYDPNLKDEAFLQSFLDGTNSGFVVPCADQPMVSSSGSTLVQKVKNIQRMGQGYKLAWHRFCREAGSQDFDPIRHDEGLLQMFISGVEAGQITPEEDDGKGGKGGKGGGGWGGDSWGGDDWSGMDPYTVVMMLKGMKGKMGGKGGGGGDWGGHQFLAGDWTCPACSFHNFAKNDSCKQCGATRPDGGAVFSSTDQAGAAGAASFAAAGGATTSGEIRYDNASHAEQALLLDGSVVNGFTIGVTRDQTSQDGTKLVVTGLPAGMRWQELKDHFSTIGTVAYAGVLGDVGKGGGWGGGGGGWDMKGMMKGMTKGYSPW